MSCEDDQAECYGLYEELKRANVLVEDNVQEIDELFDDFSKAYDNDDEVGDILEEVGLLLKYINDTNNLNFNIPWFLK